jgi:hypothetical protein
VEHRLLILKERAVSARLSGLGAQAIVDGQEPVERAECHNEIGAQAELRIAPRRIRGAHDIDGHVQLPADADNGLQRGIVMRCSEWELPR